MQHKLVTCQDDEVKRQILLKYLNSMAKIGEQLSNERERQLNNLYQKFESKLVVLQNKQKQFIDKFKCKFKTLCLRQKTLRKYRDAWKQSNKSYSSSVYSEMKYVFVDSNLMSNKGWVSIDDITLCERPTSARDPEVIAELFADNREQL